MTDPSPPAHTRRWLLWDLGRRLTHLSSHFDERFDQMANEWRQPLQDVVTKMDDLRAHFADFVTNLKGQLSDMQAQVLAAVGDNQQAADAVTAAVGEMTTDLDAMNALMAPPDPAPAPTPDPIPPEPAPTPPEPDPAPQARHHRR